MGAIALWAGLALFGVALVFLFAAPLMLIISAIRDREWGAVIIGGALTCLIWGLGLIVLAVQLGHPL